MGAFVRKLSADESSRIRRCVQEAFNDKTKTNAADAETYAWSKFHPCTRSWTDVAASIDVALQTVEVATGFCWLFEEEWRDELVFKIKSDAIERFVKKAWYPSRDAYICDEHFGWCLAFIHHDAILLYRAVKP